jgi:hypothetical protein
MKPSNDVLSRRESNEAYCLAESGRQFAVFFTCEGDRTVDIDLSLAQGQLSLRWLDVAASRWAVATPVTAGGVYTLKAPGQGPFVAVLTTGKQDQRG